MRTGTIYRIITGVSDNSKQTILLSVKVGLYGLIFSRKRLAARIRNSDNEGFNIIPLGRLDV